MREREKDRDTDTQNTRLYYAMIRPRHPPTILFVVLFFFLVLPLFNQVWVYARLYNEVDRFKTAEILEAAENGMETKPQELANISCNQNVPTLLQFNQRPLGKQLLNISLMMM